jgi:hypothetical protein
MITLDDFTKKCKKFDWQWYWRDTARPDAQVALLKEAQQLGPEFVAVYEMHRAQAQNPYCPAPQVEVTS